MRPAPGQGEQVAEAVVTLETQVGLEVLVELVQQAHLKPLTAYQYHQEQQHQLQWLHQEVKSLYHGTHNEISTRYLLRW
jgi:hypothetical protein